MEVVQNLTRNLNYELYEIYEQAAACMFTLFLCMQSCTKFQPCIDTRRMMKLFQFNNIDNIDFWRL